MFNFSKLLTFNIKKRQEYNCCFKICNDQALKHLINNTNKKQ